MLDVREEAIPNECSCGHVHYTELRADEPEVDGLSQGPEAPVSLKEPTIQAHLETLRQLKNSIIGFTEPSFV